MADSRCDGKFVPKASAPPNWIVRTTDLYSGRNIDLFAGVYRAAEFRGNAAGSPEQLAQRLSDWRKALEDEAGKVSRSIVDLGLTPDLCAGGRPPDPDIPDFSPEALANGSVGNAILELVKQQYFDQYCQCQPRDAERETCPCITYTVTSEISRENPGGFEPFPQVFNVPGKISSIRRESVVGSGTAQTRIGYYYGLGCPSINDGNGEFLTLVIAPDDEASSYNVGIRSIAKTFPFEEEQCNPEPAPEEPPPYEPGITGVPGFQLPPPLPVPLPVPLPAPVVPIPFVLPIGTPVNCPPCEECEEPDMYYWDLKKEAPLSILFSGELGMEGITIGLNNIIQSISIEFDFEAALANQELRNYRRQSNSNDPDEVYVRTAQLFLRSDGGAVHIQRDAICRATQITRPFELRNQPISISILPFAPGITFRVLDDGYRWKQEKFDKI